MTVRAKFKVDTVERGLTNVATGHKDENGRDIYAPKEIQTIVMSLAVFPKWPASPWHGQR